MPEIASMLYRMTGVAMMKTFATQLSDQDAANVAAYYASLKAK